MKCKINRNNLYRTLLSLAVFESSVSALSISDNLSEIIHSTCLILFLSLSLICIVFSRHSKRLLVINLLVYIFAVASYFISRNTDFMITLLLIMLNQYNSNNTDQLLKIIYGIKLPVLLCGIMLSFIGILDIGTIVQFGGDKGTILGFSNANGFSGHCGIIMLLWIAIHRNDKKLYKCIPALMFIEGIVFYLTKSRTGLLAIGLMIIFILLKSFRPYMKHFLKISKWILPALIGSNFLLIFFQYNNMFRNLVENILGKFFNGRILLAAMNIRTYPITLFGRYVDRSIIEGIYNYTALDNGYTYLLISYGIVGIGIQVIVMQIAMLQLREHNEYILCVITFLLAFWTLYEAMMIGATTNFTMLFSTEYISLISVSDMFGKKRKGVGV